MENFKLHPKILFSSSISLFKQRFKMNKQRWSMGDICIVRFSISLMYFNIWVGPCLCRTPSSLRAPGWWWLWLRLPMLGQDSASMQRRWNIQLGCWVRAELWRLEYYGPVLPRYTNIIPPTSYNTPEVLTCDIKDDDLMLHTSENSFKLYSCQGASVICGIQACTLALIKLFLVLLKNIKLT